MTRREAMSLGVVLRWGLVLLALALAAAVQTGLAYRTHPIAFLAPVVLAGLVVIFLRPMTGVYLALLAIPLELFEAQVGSAALTATEGLLLLTAAVTVARSVFNRFQLRASLRPAHVAFIGVLVVSGLGLFVARDATVVREVLVLWTAFLVVSVLVASASDDQLERVLICLVIAGGVVGLVALLRTANPTAYEGGQDIANRAEGTFGHPNQLAFFLILTIPIAMGLVSRHRTALKVLGVSAAAVETAALLMTFSRSGIIGLVVTFLVLAAWPGFRRTAAVAVVIVIVFSVFNARAISENKEVSLLAKRLATVTSASGRSQNPRLPIYRTALTMIGDRPWLGVGHRNFSKVSPQYGLLGNYGNPYVHAHNVFLTVAVETGIAGLSFFVAFLGMLAHAAWVAVKRRWDVYPLVLGIAAALAGLVVTGITEYPLGINVVMATFLILAGALLAYARSFPSEPAASPSGDSPRGAGRLVPSPA